MVMKHGSAALAAVVALSGILAACGGGNSSGGAKDGKSSGPTEISIFLNQQTPEVMPSDNPVLKEIEKRTNTKLNIIWVPQNTMNEKTKVTLASGDIPDLMLAGLDPQVRQMAQQGAFWDITPYIKDYKNLNAVPKEVWDNLKINGKIYGIPRVRPLDGGGSLPMLRKDWLDKLGLKVPETMDDLYAVAKAFTEKDPDGNGKADTVGITGQVNPEDMGNLGWVEQVFNHAAGSWKLKDGKLVPTVTEPGTKQALQWLNKAYNEKVLVQDFGVLKYSQSRDLLMASKAGIIGSAMDPTWLFTEAIRKTEPKADMIPVNYMVSPEGKFAVKDVGYLNFFVIPKKVPEDKMHKLLAFMDYGMSDEGSDLANFGLKDVHYAEKDGFKVATEQAKKDMVGANILGTMFAKYEKYRRAYLNGIPKDMYDRAVKIIDERAKVSVPDPAVGIVSDTEEKLGPDYNKKAQDLKTKIIMGKEPISAWDDYVAKLKADPQFLKMIEEKNAAYKNK